MKKYLIGFIFGLIVSLGSFVFFINFIAPIRQTIDFSTGDKLENIVEKKASFIQNAIDGIKTSFSNGNIDNEDKLIKINEIKKILDTQFLKPEMISGYKMWDAAIQAYVAAVGDPFTVYLTAKDNKSLHEELKGSSDFQGIGAIVTKVPEGIMIEQLIKSGPAQKSGLKPLDIILEANGTGLADLPLGKGVNLIKGPAGTEVELTIKRDGKIFKVKVKREKIKLTSVNSQTYTVKGKKIGYISISTIGEETYDQFKRQLDDLLKQGIKGIILDLRGNGGGYLDIGYKIGVTWAKEGDIVVQTKYRNPIFNKIFKSLKTGKLYNYPTIILVDGYTASAGEIITAAIRENNPKTAKIVGTKTFGKGTIQTLKEFLDGSSLKYTIGQWLTPKGENVSKDGIHPGKGIKPDVEIKFDADKYKKTLKDNQLEKAKEEIIKMIK